MCGRFSLGLNRGQIHQVRGWNRDLQVGEWVDEQAFHPRHNVAPRSNGVVLRRRASSGSDAPAEEDAKTGAEPELIMQTMRWGLVPHWSKHEDKTLSTTNARAEALVEGGGMWATIKGKKRCVVLCEGYFEWLKKGKDRIPYFMRPKDGNQLMLLAGLWDCVTLEGEKEPLWTFTIVTTDANKEFSWLHDRQPVILSSKAVIDVWLDTSSQQWTSALTNLVKPYSDSTAPLECYQVPKEVGKVGTESAAFIEPVAGRKDGIKAMFAKQTSSLAKPSSSQPKEQPSPSPSSVKRKRVATPPDEDAKEAKFGVTQKRPKIEKLDTWEDHDQIEYLGTSSTDDAAVQPQSKNRALSASPKKGKNSTKATLASSGSRAITDFFPQS